jgi:DNA-binding NarL/FixJ family response regulator
LIFTVHNSSLLAEQAFQAGASAFLTKLDANKLLVTAVESLLAHKPFCTGNCVENVHYGAKINPDVGHGLTPREQLVVKLVAEGYSNKDISSILSLSIKTTDAHRAAAMRKLDVHSTAGLVRYAARTKLIEV